MIKSILAVIGGYALWTVVFLAGGAALRSAMSSVHDADGITTDVPALVLYLLVSMLASVGAGYVAAVISKANVRRDAIILAVALLATGIPVQMSVWDVIPVWYNAAFLILLAPLTIWGSMLKKEPTSQAG